MFPFILFHSHRPAKYAAAAVNDNLPFWQKNKNSPIRTAVDRQHISHITAEIFGKSSQTRLKAFITSPVPMPQQAMTQMALS